MLRVYSTIFCLRQFDTPVAGMKCFCALLPAEHFKEQYQILEFVLVLFPTYTAGFCIDRTSRIPPALWLTPITSSGHYLLSILGTMVQESQAN